MSRAGAKPRGVPEKTTRALAAYAKGGLSIREVANIFGIAQSTLATAVAAARRERDAAPEDELTC